MVQISPQKDLPIIRQLEDHTDTDTNYVQAKVYKASDNSVIGTVNLTDNSGQYFYGNWRTIADTSGEGTWIVIITTVYTDSGYTTKNPNYGLETRDYLIKSDQSLGGFGGGVDIDYKKIKKMIDEAITGIPKVEIPESEKIDYEKIINEIAVLEVAVRDAVNEVSLAIPQQKETDLSQIYAEFETLKQQIESLPKYKEPNLDRVINHTNNMNTDVVKSIANYAKDFGKFKEIIGLIKQLEEKIDGLQFSVVPKIETKEDNKLPL